MKMRNLLLTLALLSSGIANAQEIAAPEVTEVQVQQEVAMPEVTKAQVYKQELDDLKVRTELQSLFDTKLNGISRKIERNIHNFKRIPSPWQRLGLMFILEKNILCVGQDDMPELWAFVNALAVKSGISAPYIFITLGEGPLNVFATKIIKPAAIVIDQSAINKFSDEQLQAALAHEIGHLKNEHTNKRMALLLSTFALSCYFLGGTARAIADYMVKNGNDFIKRQSVLIENQLRIMGAVLIAKLVDGLVIGKRFEKQADQFAFEAGYASAAIEAFTVFQKERDILENDLIATKERIAHEQGSLAPENIQVLNQEFLQLELKYRIQKWIHENTPFEEHPKNADRIAAAQAYLDAQVQTPAIEKA